LLQNKTIDNKIPAKLFSTHEGVPIDDIANEFDSTSNMDDTISFLSILGIINIYSGFIIIITLK